MCRDLYAEPGEAIRSHSPDRQTRPRFEMSLQVSLRAFGEPWKAGELKNVNSHRPLPLCAPPPQKGQIRRSALVVHLGRNRKIFEAGQMSAPPGAASRSAARTRVTPSPAHPPGGSAWPLV